MSAWTATLTKDVRLQSRAKLYTIGIGVAVGMGLLARFLFGSAPAGRVLAAFYLLGLGGTTYMFGAALVLLEKSEGTLQALRVSPLTTRQYIASKTLTLTTFALFESAIVYLIGFPGTPTNALILLFGVLALGVMYALLGLGQVTPHATVTSFLVPGAFLVAGVLQLPFLYLLDIGPPVLWHLIPSQGPLLLMLGAFEPLEAWQWMYAWTMSGVAIGAAGVWAAWRFRRDIGLQRS